MEPLFLEPIFMDRIWGGSLLKDKFNYNITSPTTGECWAISSHEHGDCVISSGIYKGKRLSQLWNENKELFGNTPGDKFPLLTKILDANENLSVQVHPNDEYAKNNENGELGKSECWYIIDCNEDSEIILGHNAKSREELESMVNKNQWEKLLKIVKIKKGDFFYVPSGTIHAIRKGALILETQQNSDTTYRLYDYDRLDSTGSKRKLNIEKAIACTNVPDANFDRVYTVVLKDNFRCTTFVSNEFFSVHKLDIFGECKFTHDKPFSLYSVIDGSGKLIHGTNEYTLIKGVHFILPYDIDEFTFSGNMEIICSHV